MRKLALLGLISTLLPTLGAAADEVLTAVRPDAFLASDADGNEVAKTGLGWDFWRKDREHWIGLDIQHAQFSGEGWAEEEQRGYLNAGGTFGASEITDDTWRWQFRLGSNGDTALGSASLHTEGPHRREILFEREVLETEAGLERRQMYNFIAAAMDHPFSEGLTGTALVGVQTFGDGNERTHLRTNLVFAVVPEKGLSVQARTRYFQNSEPYLGGYYSPEWYGEWLGVIAMRRVVSGYTLRGAIGYGAQRTGDENWKRARLVELGFESPRWRQSWIRIVVGYSDTPVATSTGIGNYSYRYAMLESVVAF